MNKIPYFGGFAWVISLLFSIAALPANAEEAASLDRIAAVVNNDVIMLSEAQHRAQILKAPLKQAIDELIMERLQTQKAVAAGIQVDDVILNKAVENVARQNNLDLPAFQQALQQEGIHYDDFRAQTKRKLMIDALRKRQMQGNVKVSEQEVNDLITSQTDSLTKGERFNLQHILIAVPTGTPVAQVNAARERAEKLRRRLLSGADFTQLAQMESDSYAAKNGGNLGWQEAEKLPASFNRILAIMQPGEISEVVRDSQGFHILKLLERQGGKRQMAMSTHVRHILVSTVNQPDEQAKQKIDAIYQQLQQGADFGALARQNSDDSGSGAKGGDLGWISPGQTVAPFEQTMNQTALNAMSMPFKSEFGWHILQVLERNQTDQTNTVLRDKATEFLGDRKAEEQYQAWLQSLRNDAYIDYRIALENNDLRLR